MKHNLTHRPPQEQVDEHMTGIVATAFLAEYMKYNGSPPTNADLSSFIDQMTDEDKIGLVRSYKGAEGLQSQLRNDTDILRWAEAVRTRTASNAPRPRG